LSDQTILVEPAGLLIGGLVFQPNFLSIFYLWNLCNLWIRGFAAYCGLLPAVCLLPFGGGAGN